MSSISNSTQYPSKAHIRDVFAHLTRAEAQEFYKHVADDVDWTVMGTHALSGHYTDKKSFLEKSVARVSAVLEGPLRLRVRNVIGGEVEEWAVVEMTADATCKNGLRYDNTYSWSTRWKDGKIVQVRAYLDGILLDRALADNEMTI
ncbi:MAG: hypothetical protein M1818_002483 [Claussenomyces sp. TS43310]|nr:MAG: hypothetical protein M1818_002483 [Claussenomyces sp. TS43310]